MQPIDVYLMYCAMKAHFGKTDYNFIKYGGKSRVSRNSFFKRKDRYFFVKLSKKYKTENEIRNYFVANFMMEQRGYVANFNDENYEKWQNRQNNFHDIFTNEIAPEHNTMPISEDIGNMIKSIENAVKPIFNISGSLLQSISLRFLSHDTHIDKIKLIL